ncbi:MAG: universal stress protein [Myxococcales bacterium]|nr:universal stress protein [Myxococcales bacterium]
MLLPNSILVPVDFSECSREALEVAYGYAERFVANVTVLHAWQTPHFVSPDLMVSLPNEPGTPFLAYVQREAEAGLREFLDPIPVPPGVNVEHRLEVGEAAEVIENVLDEGKHQLVVMGTHGRKGLQRLLMGSVAEQTVRSSPVPVLTVPRRK